MSIPRQNSPKSNANDSASQIIRSLVLQWRLRALKPLLWIWIGCIAASLTLMFLFNVVTPYLLGTLLGATVASILAMWQANQGRVALGSTILVTLTWILLAMVILRQGGITIPGVIFFGLPILFTGFFVRPRGAILVAVLTLAFLATVAWGQHSGRLVTFETHYLPVRYFVIHTANILFVTTFAYLAARAINRSIAEVQSAHEQLHIHQRELEQRTVDLQVANRALASSEERFRHVLDNTADGIFLIDSKGQIRDVNIWAIEELGYCREELLDMNVTDIDAAWSSSQVANNVEQMPASGSIAISGEHRRKNGTTFPVEVKLGRFLLNGETLFVGSARDTSERLLAQQALNHAQRLQSLGLLAGGVAHDFNNLLVAMLGQTSLAMRLIPPENRARQHVERAVNAANRAALLTRQLLAYSGRGHFQAISLDVNSLITQNLELFHVGIPSDIELQTELADALPPIIADPGQIQQVIMNLIINGAEAIENGRGHVTVTTGIQQIDGSDSRYQQFTATSLRAGTYVTIDVHDNGCGMAPETIERIFDPFYTNKSSGHGLGLAAVQGIVRGHNGGLGVYSEPGTGTTFKLLFPASDKAESAPSQGEQFSDISAPDTTILVIDDDDMVRESVHDILSTSGYSVLEATDGRTGIELFIEQQARINLILLDLTMPGLSGQETLRELRHISADVAVILSSGYNQVEAARTLLGRSRVGFLQKPYTEAELLKRVAKHLTATEQEIS